VRTLLLSYRGALAAIVSLMAAANIARSLWLPEISHLVFNLGLTAVVVYLGRRAGLRGEDLGLGNWQRGAVFGAAAVGVIAIGLVAAALLSTSVVRIADAFDDDRADISAAELLVRVIVIIPIGTALAEELMFRGVIFGLLIKMRAPAILISSVLFSLWHLLPAGLDQGNLGQAVATIATTFVATFCAGLLFGWLRSRSASLLAPVLAHIGTNSGALLTAWALAAR